jgi:hypothetical protein
MAKLLRRLLGLSILVGAGLALWRTVSDRTPPGSVAWETQPFPFPPQPAVETTAAWVDAAADGACPAHHPVKGKLASGIFHVPGGANYARAKADRCYRSADAAEADGLRAAKR